ncbi:hypothetical protein L798_00442 [Zootermopsis nevadensis]|uniref:Uncharacterized protein n=1 Tax=Zootermopsis nevadensis TaxID=136037 RepID=A0A067RDD7_ZOONE|nr:hypothetical protein L798_00442 [Zootermopsis nevadensis]
MANFCRTDSALERYEPPTPAKRIRLLKGMCIHVNQQWYCFHPPVLQHYIY